MKEKRKDFQRVFVLGAGFSKPAGLPLCLELFDEIKKEAKERGVYDGLKTDLESFLEYQHKTKIETITENEINFEDFISYLDIEHFLQLKGSDHWSDEGNTSQLIVKNLIARILYNKELEMQNKDLYEKFAEKLNHGDTIITFNYDTILESTFLRKGIPYRLFPDRDNSDTNGEIILLKMHGSIDWFDISAYDREQISNRKYPFHMPPDHNIFARRKKPFHLEKILDESYESPLQNIYKNYDLAEYLNEEYYTSNPPLIISPSHSKMVYLNPLTEFWRGNNKSGVASSTVTIIGFSLPEHDEYIRQPLYHLVNNFQNNDYFEDFLEKTNLKMIDYKQNQADIDAYKKNYSFVNWSKTDCYFDGFDEKSLEVIFGKS